jgi:ArsR family transcriptional regulator
MRQRGIVKKRKEGLSVFYRITNPKIVKACDLVREVLFEQMEERKETLKKWK